MKKSIASVTLLVAAMAATSASAKVCVTATTQADGSVSVTGTCDQTKKNKKEDLVLDMNGCAAGQVAIPDSVVSIDDCKIPGETEHRRHPPHML